MKAGKKIGIKFCGGCNPRYNRRKLVDEIIDKCPELDFEFVKHNETYEKLIVVGGCTNNCASYEEYTILGGIFKISDENDIVSLIEELKL